MIELLVVIAIMIVLAGMLLPALAKARMATQSVACSSNLKQLQACWVMYADEHNDTLPPNNIRAVQWQGGCPEGYPSISGTWVLGNPCTDRNAWGIKNGVLFPYVQVAGPYHCPSDKSTLDRSRWTKRTRSYSASFYMNGNKSSWEPNVKSKACEIRQPAKVFVFLDEHEKTIDDGVFFVHTPGDTGEMSAGPHWMDLPSDRHNQGCSLSFADGRVEHWSWKWPKRILSPGSDQDVANASDFEDLRRLQAAIPDVP